MQPLETSMDVIPTNPTPMIVTPTPVCYKHALCKPVPFGDVMATLNLALLAVQSVHGEERTRLDARYASDPKRFAVVIDASTPAGNDLNLVFSGFARREFGEGAFRIDRVIRQDRGSSSPAAAA